MSDLNAALNFIQAISSGIANQDDIERKYNNALNAQENNFQLQQLSKELDRNYTEEQRLVMDEQKLVLNDIASSLHKLNLYGLTETELTEKISDKFKTEDADKLMDDWNVELKNGYIFQANTFNDNYDYFDSVRKSSEKNREVLGVLKEMGAQIDTLPSYYAKAGTEQGIKNVVDIMDLSKMIDDPQYRDVFKKEVDDPLNKGKKIWVDNYLATAFKTPQRIDAKIGRYGSKIEYSEQELMARGIDPRTYMPIDDEEASTASDMIRDEDAKNNLIKQQIILI